MLNFADKISILENYLLQINDNYADSFKTDIALFLGEFDNKNSNLNFLNNLSSKIEIENWINNLISKIVLKFNEDEEQLSDFIFYALNP
ncbi:MAG TPA: hypothetical protein PKK18_07785 [Chitinophagales bacterium]|nr:hypothetical protein [Chitinophagales bacterium]HMW13574.1 hypothetical protein [Chitinophagales bacterium]HMX61131.1 hypothetical protein [Chitinophagales bacterium]HMZ34471.1 hypothetical protein [Chitinophagales bacterium]HNA38494.1 hypothetical protein [Chitinophagales bacterium]